jgi:probable F420-dependent oxidoreductase
MQFGVHLPTYWPNDATSKRMAVEEAAQAAAALNYVSVWANDAVIVSAEHAWAAHVIEPLITLASLIHLVPTMKLGLAVLVLAQRNAIIVAKQAAALDLLSQGRFILGVGTGWRAAEFKFLNTDFARRGAVTDEAIAVLHALWREPVANFHGQLYDFSDALFFPKPVSDPVPLWVGGNTSASVRRAARYGAAWIPFGIGLDDFRSGVTRLRALTAGQQCPMIAAEMFLRIDKPGKPRELGSAHIAGSPETIAQVLNEYRQAGLEYLICLFEANTVEDLLHQMQVFAEQIAPQFTETT